MKNPPPTERAPARRRAGLAVRALGLALFLVAGTSSAALRTELDRSAVHEGETLTLTIESDGAASGGQPDLAPLQRDFRVLGSSMSNQVNMINGRTSIKTQWRVQLQPRRLGKLEIPSLALAGDRSAPLEVDVSENSAQASLRSGQHLLLEAELPKGGRSFHVGQQIPYTLRLYYDDALREGSLEAPQIDDALIEQLGEEKRYTTQRNGRQLNVVERRYAITAEKSGPLRIPPARFQGRVEGAMDVGRAPARASSMMEEFLRNTPFANDPMFKDSFAGLSGFADPGQPVSVQSQAVSLDIRPRPAAAAGGQWLPAEQVTLTDSWSERTPQFKVGEPVTRTITVAAKGLLGTQIPEIDVAQPAQARLYREASTNDSSSDGETIEGISRQRLTYIPTEQGKLSIPAVELDWWNTRNDTQSRASLPPHEFYVAPGIAGAQDASAPAPAATAAAPPAVTPAAAAAQNGAPIVERAKQHWPYLAGGGAVLLAGIAALALAWRRRGQRRAGTTAADAEPALARPRPDAAAALRALRDACAADNGRAAARALLDLGAARWPDSPPRALGALAARLEQGAEEVMTLDRSLYGSDTSPWTGAALWAVFKRGVSERRAERLQVSDGLDPLYR